MCEKRRVFIYWDIENCILPPNINILVILDRLRNYVLHEMIPSSTELWIHRISVYINHNIQNNYHPTKRQYESLKRDPTVHIRQFPKSADIYIIEDMYDCLLDHLTHQVKPVVVLISSDIDFSRVVNRFMYYGFDVCLIYSKEKANPIMYNVSKYSKSWDDIILGNRSSITNTPTLNTNNPPMAESKQKKNRSRSGPPKKIPPPENILQTSHENDNFIQIQTKIDPLIAKYLEIYKMDLIMPTLKNQFGNNLININIMATGAIQLSCMAAIQEACLLYFTTQFVSKIQPQIVTLPWTSEYFALFEKCYQRKLPVCQIIHDHQCLLEFRTSLTDQFEIAVIGEEGVQRIAQFLSVELSPFSVEILMDLTANIPLQNNKSMVEIATERLSLQDLRNFYVELNVIYDENKSNGINLIGFKIHTSRNLINFVSDCVRWLLKETEAELQPVHDSKKKITRIYRFKKCEDPQKFAFLSMKNLIANMVSSKFGVQVNYQQNEEENKSTNPPNGSGFFDFQFNMSGIILALAKAESALGQLQSSEIISETVSFSEVDEDFYFHLLEHCDFYRNIKNCKIVPVKTSSSQNLRYFFDMIFIQLKPNFGEFMARNKSVMVLISGTKELEEKIQTIKNSFIQVHSSFEIVSRSIPSSAMNQIYQRAMAYPEVEFILNENLDASAVAKLLNVSGVKTFHDLWKKFSIYFYYEQKTRQNGAEVFGLKKLARSYDLVSLRLNREKNIVTIKGNRECIEEFEKKLGLNATFESNSEVIRLQADNVIFKVFKLEYYKNHFFESLKSIISQNNAVKLLTDNETTGEFSQEDDNQQKIDENLNSKTMDNAPVMKEFCQIDASSPQNLLQIKKCVNDILIEIQRSIVETEKSELFCQPYFLNNLQEQFRSLFNVILEIQDVNANDRGLKVKIIGFQECVNSALQELEEIMFNETVCEKIKLDCPISNDFLVPLLDSHELFLVDQQDESTIYVGCMGPTAQTNIQELKLSLAAMFNSN